MIKVEFTNANFTVIKQTREDWMNKGWHPGVITDFDSRMGKGVLFLLELEKGLTVVLGDNTAEDDILYINKAYLSDDISLFTLDYLVMGDGYIVGKRNGKEAKKHPILNKAVMHHSKSDFSFLIQKERRVRVIDIIFSHEWLLDQFPSSQRDTVTAQIRKIEDLRPFYIDPISARSFEIVMEVLDKVFYGNWDFIFLKPRILSLIEEFVKNHILSVDNKNEISASEEMSLTMIEVKRKINATLYEKPPSMKTLAKEFLLSESTLSRRFKNTFGKSINQYHFDEKMELAKRILRRDEYTISQIAYLLSYETVSAFNKSFKKHFGISPGALRKNGIDRS